MAKDRRKLQHIHSSIPDKQPTAASLEVGEIAVNNAKGQEFFSIKNSEDKVVRFSSDGQIIEWIERKEVMPYEGFTRGSEGPEGSTGPDSVTNDDLLQNKSNIIIKLNQVAADNTVKHDKVNGAKDIYNKPVNPTEDFGVSDGAGFAIDMSRYAMIDANPSFSSLTVTVQTDLSGNTTISNGAGVNEYGTDSGHTLTIKTTDVVATDTNWTETITNQNSTITTLNESATTRTTKIGTENLNVSGTTTEVKVGDVTESHSGSTTENFVGSFIRNTTGTTTETKIGNVTESHSGTTTETKKGNVTENNLANKVENTTGNSSMYSTGNTCIDSQSSANFYGKINTNIGTACDGTTKASATTVIGTSTLDLSGTTTTLSANSTTINSCSGFTLNSNVVTIDECAANGQLTINETNTDLSGSTLEIIENTSISAKTSSASLSGSTLVIDEGTSVSAKTPITTLSGTNLTINESNTTISSCTKVDIITNALNIKQCATGGTAEMEFCGGYAIKSDDVKIQQCSTVGTISIVEKDTTISGGTLTIRESGATNFSGAALTEATTGNTTVNVGGNLVENVTGNTNINTTGATNITGTGNVCIKSNNSANFYGKVGTNIGVACDGTVGSAATISSTTINIGGTNVNITGATKISGTTIIGGETTINNNLNVTGNTNITGATNISGATTIDDDLTVTGNLYLTPDCTAKITSTTVNSALCEILDRNAVTMTTVTPAATSEILKTYKLWQNGEQIGEDINIPKDHLLKSADVAYGKLNGSTFTPCTAAASDCHWYIKLVWNVFDPSTGHADDKTTYIPADDFIKDIDDSNPTDVGTAANHNVVVDVWYDGEKNLVSASTTPTMNVTNLYASNTITGVTVSGTTGKFTTLNAGTTTISGATTINNTLKVTGNTTLAATTANTISATSVSSPTISGTNITASSAIKANNVSANTISAATKVTTKDLDATGNVNITGTTNISGATKIDDKLTVTDVLDAQNGLSHKLSISFGEVGSIAGNPYNGSGDTTVVIPNHSSAYTHYNLNIVHNGLNKTYDPASSAVTSMTLPHSALTWEYGSVTSKTSTSNDYTYNTSAGKTITIPKTVKDVGIGDLIIQKNGTSVGTYSGASKTINITVPTSTDDITNNLKYLKWSLGTPSADTTGYNGSTSKTITIPSKVSNLTNDLNELTIETGNTYVSGNPYNGSSTAKIVVPTSVDNLTNYTSYSDGAIHLPHNVVVTGRIEASNGFFQTSDERKKDNIKNIEFNDFNKAKNVMLKSFTFKDDETHRKVYGAIAQEIEGVGLGELVYTDQDGYKSVDYTSLLMLKIAYLESYCDTLNLRITELENKINGNN